MAGMTWDSSHVVHLLSEERMATYISAADGDLDNAFALYAWNIELAAALQGATAMVEVVTRNAIDSALTAWYRQKRQAMTGLTCRSLMSEPVRIFLWHRLGCAAPA